MHQQFDKILEKLTLPISTIAVVKHNIEQELKLKTKRKKNNLNNIQNEMRRLESENNTIIDKIATCTTEFVQQ